MRILIHSASKKLRQTDGRRAADTAPDVGRGGQVRGGLTAGVAELPHRAGVDETPPLHKRYCDFCEETGHGVFECSEREDWHEDRALPEAARRLDPVCRDP